MYKKDFSLKKRDGGRSLESLIRKTEKILFKKDYKKLQILQILNRK